MAAIVSGPTSAFFSASYRQARAQFLAAAQRADATHHAFAHPADPGLCCDAAVVAQDSPWALVTLSGTHGIEGFCGSAIQSYLLHHLARSTTRRLFQLHVHGLNAWGMQHFSRTDEQRVDLNRNRIDFTQPLPINPLYPLVHEQLDFAEWRRPALERFWMFQRAFVAAHGLTGWNKAFSGGQYAYPDGVMYGGAEPSWSTALLPQLIALLPTTVTTVIVLDLHTGVGQFGEALILVQRRTPAELAARLPAMVALPHMLVFDTQPLPLSTANFSGLVVGAWSASAAEVIPLVVEYGTYPAQQMIEAILYDRWLSLQPDAAADQRGQLLERYCPADGRWRQRVLDHAWALLEAIGQSAAGG